MTHGRRNVLVVAGEASGDLHASKVVSRLREIDPTIDVFGVGGDRMRDAGCELVFHSDDFAVVGLVEVLRHVPRLRSAMERLVDLAVERETRLAVLVDYPGFNLMLARRLRRLGIRVLYYVSPQVWAWGEGRVRKIAERVDRMAVVLPFEVEFYADRGVKVEFVGHPLLEEPAVAAEPSGAAPDGIVLGLLPGSRRHEIERHLPPMLGAVELLRGRVDGLTVRLGRARGISDEFLAENGDPARAGVEVLPPDDVHRVMRGSTALLIASGTATLEAACLGVPMVVVYKLAWLSYVAGRALVRIPHIGLVNVVAGRKVVPELVQGEACASRMAEEVRPFLSDPALREETSRRLLEVQAPARRPGGQREGGADGHRDDRGRRLSRRRAGLSLWDRVLVGAVGRLGPLLLMLLGSTWRVAELHTERVDEVHATGRAVVFAFWHGVLLPLEFICRDRNIQVLSSWHRDGEMSARLMTALGYGVVRGSSTRGSARGLLRMLARAVEGFDLAVTPDGPKGPARSVKRGIFYLAERSGGRLIPVGVGASRAGRLSSWDSFMVPLPFSRVTVVYGEPLAWDASAPFDEKAATLKAAIERLSAEAAEAALR